MKKRPIRVGFRVLARSRLEAGPNGTFTSNMRGLDMKIGYIRVSTQEQNTIRQEVLMESLGVDEVYIDRSFKR